MKLIWNMSLHDDSVLRTLTDVCGNGWGRISIRDLARRSKVSPATAILCVRRLELAGLIEVDYHRGRATHVYRVLTQDAQLRRSAHNSTAL
jgi:Mn-dependent DtxR family transcriptional regulator